MPAEIIDGRAAAAELRADLLRRGSLLRERGISPRLVVAIVGEDAASLAYVRSLVNAGKQTAIDVDVDVLPADAEQRAVCAQLERLGTDPRVHGVILQQPLPKHLAIREIAASIPRGKDVDGSNPINQGLLAFGTGTDFVPATPAAVMILLERSPAWPLRGKYCVVVGRSSVVGLPAMRLMMLQDATVTVAHRATRDLPSITRQAEVVVAAAGVPGLITGEMLRPGCTVIDVGTTVIDGKLVGDVDFPSAAAVAGALTPVPGGVGPVTNVALMRNVIGVCERLRAGD